MNTHQISTSKNRFVLFVRKLEQSTVIKAVKSGLVNMIPVLIIGAFALIVKTFPVAGYQNFINNFAHGLIYKLSDVIYSSTFGVLSVYMTFSISRSYMKIKSDPTAVNGGAIIAALISFFILSGSYIPEYGIDYIGPKSMFLAIITGLGASSLFVFFNKVYGKRRVLLFSQGADIEFNRMLTAFLPILTVVVIFAIINVVVMGISQVDSFRSLLISIFDLIFSHMPDGFFKGFVFVLLSSILWFFGIHGSDTLETVMQKHFVGGLAINQAAVQAGNAPTEILNKPFFDSFVLMGGCGATICLLIALLIFSRNRAHRGLSYTAIVPMLFNINELMVFGLPIILNPIMIVPFLLVPLVCYSVSYLALSIGLVPLVTNSIEWTTPVLLGGYSATGSIAGSLLQLFNILIGVLIYFPFVKILDRHAEENLKRDYEAFIDYFKKNEDVLSSKKLTTLGNRYGDFAKSLCADMKHGIKDKIVLAYQPQYNYEGKCVGVEALLRYNHHLHGIIYPPLVVKLAEEGGFLPILEEAVFRKALEDKDRILAKFGQDIKISVNVTGTTVTTPRFQQFCRLLRESDKLKDTQLCIEVTEQAALSFNKESIAALRNLHTLGYTLAIDDFSMGQTSINYLKDNIFDEIKLDGSLVKGLYTHDNCREIISSITGLASTLNLIVLAEYVETEEQRDILHEIGCDYYQGYLYSPAIYLDEKDKKIVG